MKAAVYLRISLDLSGDGLAIERQREDCLKIIQSRGWELLGIFEDTQSASSSKVRPGYSALIDSFRQGSFQALVCWDLDRLTRKPRELEDWIDWSSNGSLVLVTANGEADLTTDAGRLFARIKASVARSEVERKGARQRRAQRQRAEQGRPPKGPRLTGYDSDGAIVHGESQTIEYIFEQFTSGQSLLGIAKALNAKGVETRRGAAWSPSSVRTILTNPRYAGISTYKGERINVQASWSPIVSKDRFELAQSILLDPSRKKNRTGTDRKYLGSGLYQCGFQGCGRPLTSSGNQYYCKAGGHVSRIMRPIDDLVEEVIALRLKSLKAAPESTPGSDTEDLKQLLDRRARFENDYDQGLIDGKRFKVAMDKVELEIEALRVKAASKAGLNAMAALNGNTDFGEAFRNATVSTKQAIARSLLTIHVDPWPQGVKGFDPRSVRFEWK